MISGPRGHVDTMYGEAQEVSFSSTRNARVYVTIDETTWQQGVVRKIAHGFDKKPINALRGMVHPLRQMIA